MDIKPVNPTPPVSPPRKIEKQDPRREDKRNERRRPETPEPDDDQHGIDTYA